MELLPAEEWGKKTLLDKFSCWVDVPFLLERKRERS